MVTVNSNLVLSFLKHFFEKINSNLNISYSPEYLVQEDVVVVTLNYRLGVLGFLCLPDAGISGNAGLKDQLAAMKWVNKNISKFGGDASNITVITHNCLRNTVNYNVLSYSYSEKVLERDQLAFIYCVKSHGNFKSIDDMNGTLKLLISQKILP